MPLNNTFDFYLHRFDVFCIFFTKLELNPVAAPLYGRMARRATPIDKMEGEKLQYN